MSKKIIVLAVLISLIAFSGIAQTSTTGGANVNDMNSDTAQQALAETGITSFETAAMWRTNMSRDFGSVKLRTTQNDGSLDKEPLEGAVDSGINEPDENVLGVKISFAKRSHGDVMIYPQRPMPIEGITKMVHLWVVGRNANHVLKLLISDYFGNRAELIMGTLNFSGWKELSVAIPPHIVQRDYHYNDRMGIRVEGFKIECDPVEAYGDYYIYFDHMYATTDLFADENKDEDDVADSW